MLNNMKKLFVPYEIALTLKEKGFKGTTINSQYYHIKHGTIHDYDYFGHFDNMLHAPIYQEVIDWFREEHNIHIVYMICGSPTKVLGYKWYVQIGMENQCYETDMIRLLYWNDQSNKRSI